MKNKGSDSRPYPRHADFKSDIQKRGASFFKKKGYAVDKRNSYVLADDKRWPLNIILEEVADHIKREMKKRPKPSGGSFLHKGVHNGTSSQAMLFNLVGPLVVREDFEPFQQVMASRNVNWDGDDFNAEFEVGDPKVLGEGGAHPTSIDLVVRNEQRPPLFIEAKFTESEFGGCSVHERGKCDGTNPSEQHSLCYLHEKRRRKYWKLIKEYSVLDQTWRDSPRCPLADHYQFFRELLYALHEGGIFVLLYDERNPAFSYGGPGREQGLFAFLASRLPPRMQSRFVGVTIQELFQAIAATGRHDDWVPEFSEKYGIKIQG